jgi:hypothetical protein
MRRNEARDPTRDGLSSAIQRTPVGPAPFVPRIRDLPPHTIVTEWSLADVWDANDVLDAIEHAERRAWEER